MYKTMSEIKSVIESLNLIYYEYDEKMNILVLDKKCSKELTFTELINITYALNKKKINFFVDENKNIVISDSNTFSNKIQRYFKAISSYLKNRKMDIYILSDKKVKWAKNLPMFEIKPIKQDVDFSQYDALIFTSKNAIYALDAFDKTWKKKPAYVIASQTAKIVKHLGGNLKFVGKEKHGNEFALEIVKKFKHEKVLYIRASKIVSDFVEILNTNGVTCDELVVYQTVCKEFEKPIKLPKNSTIIFSSPSTIECFFKNVAWDESFKAISIGHTTARYFPENIIPVISDTTSLDSCVKKAIEINS